MKKHCLYALIGMLIFWNCSDSPNDEPGGGEPEKVFLSVTPESVFTFNETDDSKNYITVNSNTPWTATPDNEALSLDKAEGRGAGEEKIKVLDMPKGESITLTIATIATQENPSISKNITVKREAPVDPPIVEGDIVYFNNFDKQAATKTYGGGSYWPYLDQFEGWKNAEGSGSGSETYSFFNLNVRSDWTSDYSPAPSYAGKASGINNIYFSKAGGYFTIENIVLPQGKQDYVLSFGLSGNDQFNKTNLVVSLGDGSRWIPIEFTRATNSGTWDLAKSTFSFTKPIENLYLKFEATAATQIRIDDIKFTTGNPSENKIDLGKVNYPYPELPLTTTPYDYLYVYHAADLTGTTVRNYSMCFDKTKYAALWVAYPLHQSYRGSSGRTEAWAADPSISESWQAVLWGEEFSRYKDYTRGHQIPSADRTANDALNAQTFYASNMTPQSSNFNSGIWGTLEGKVRNNMCNDTLYVVTGCYFGNGYKTTLDATSWGNASALSKECPVPTHYFKILLRTRSGNTGKPIAECSESELKAIGLWFEHEKVYDENHSLATDCKSVKEIEELTGFTFFPTAPAKVKEQCTPADWVL